MTDGPATTLLDKVPRADASQPVAEVLQGLGAQLFETSQAWLHSESAFFAQESVYPLWFKYVKGPMERYQPMPQSGPVIGLKERSPCSGCVKIHLRYEHTVAELRGYGLMQDRERPERLPLPHAM